LCDKLPFEEFQRLSDYTSGIYFEKNLQSYITVIKEYSKKRKLHKILTQTLSSLNGNSADEIISSTIEQIKPLSHNVQTKNRSTMDMVRTFVDVTEGEFSVTSVGQGLDTIGHGWTSVTKPTHWAIRKSLQRLKDGGIIEKVGNRDGIYRKIQSAVNFVDLSSVPDLSFVTIRWPLKIEEWVLTSPKSITVIAGDTDAGKSALLSAFCDMNMDNLPPKKIRYFSSEMTAGRFKDRISNLPRPIRDWEKILFTEEKTVDFHDAMDPDGINVIDYLELDPARVYDVATYLRKIFDKLKTGIAIIALQKKRGQAMAYGQDWTMMKAEFYLSLSRTDEGNIAKIEKGKNWAKKRANPVGMKKKFLLVDGIKFFPDKLRPDWFKGEGNRPEDYL
jgi:hypothetical protein